MKNAACASASDRQDTSVHDFNAGGIGRTQKGSGVQHFRDGSMQCIITLYQEGSNFLSQKGGGRE